MNIGSNLNIIKEYQGVAPKNILNSIKNASTKTGVDFAYLVNQAKTESNFDPAAKAKTSSATGLYQFIDQTWLSMIKKHGGDYGLSNYADKIEIKNGKAIVENANNKKAILNLRNDPKIASLMAAELAQSNHNYLKHHVKEYEQTPTNLYLAHFMGANGAARFLNAMNQDETQIGADVFKKEARVNKGVFYDRETGEPKTLKQIHAFFEKKMNSTPTNKITEKVLISQNDAPQNSKITNQKQEALDHINKIMNETHSNALASLSSRSVNQLTPLIDSQSLFLIQTMIQDMDKNTAFL